jgi:ankyrin repeat protein
MNNIDEELIEATHANNLSEVSRLLSIGADVNVKDDYGFEWTPLHRACFYGHVQVFNKLVEYGADIEAKNCEDRTPLYEACSNDRLAVVIELLGPGASGY